MPMRRWAFLRRGGRSGRCCLFCQYRQQGRGQEGDAVVMVYEGVDSIKVVRFIDGFGEKVIFSAEALRQVVELEAFAEHDKGKVPKGGKVEALPVPCVLDEGSRVLIFRCMGKIDFFLIDWNEVDVLMMNGFWEKAHVKVPFEDLFFKMVTGPFDDFHMVVRGRTAQDVEHGHKEVFTIKLGGSDGDAFFLPQR